MVIETREWIFRVACHVDPQESAYVTGSCDSLGNWGPQNLVALMPVNPYSESEGSSDYETIWKACVHLPTESIEYRLCVCMDIQQDNEVIQCIKRWETNLHPRVVPPNISNVDDPELLSFGLIGEFSQVDQGWLVKECALFLRLCRSTVHNEPVVFWKKKHRNKKCYIKVTPISISKTSTVDSLLDSIHADESTEVELMEFRQKSRSLLPVIEVSVLKEGATEFRQQEQFGVLCTDEDYITFQCRLVDPFSIGYLMDYFTENAEGETPVYVGCSFILPSVLKDCYGVASLPITSSKHIPIGQLTVSYMVVQPLEEYKCNMKVSYARHWKDSWRGLEVGHRGAGNSFHSQTKNCSNIRENTIASLKHAWDSGADMVEFDVQLSKDMVPLIYHDFHACIALKKKKEPQKADLMEVPIKDLTLAQLQQLKVYHRTENDGLSRFSDEDWEDHQPFPPLVKAMESVPLACGFNIEVKWTMRFNDGTYAVQHPFELNRFLDCILKVILQNSSSRKIIFSCFHPDICTMLRLKQNLYPVLFLTQGKTARWPPYDDIRTSTIEKAVLYASIANILGVNVHSEDLLSDPDQIKMAFDHNLIAFCWGDQNSDRDVIRSLKEMGLHGIIYDKIDEYNLKESKKSTVFLCDDKETCRCFPSSCKSLSPSRIEEPSTTPERYQQTSPVGSIDPPENDGMVGKRGASSPETSSVPVKRARTTGFDGGAGSLTSFSSILSQTVKQAN